MRTRDLFIEEIVYPRAMSLPKGTERSTESFSHHKSSKPVGNGIVPNVSGVSTLMRWGSPLTVCISKYKAVLCLATHIHTIRYWFYLFVAVIFEPRCISAIFGRDARDKQNWGHPLQRRRGQLQRRRLDSVGNTTTIKIYCRG